MKTPQRLSTALSAARKEWRVPLQGESASTMPASPPEGEKPFVMTVQRRKQYETFLRQYSPDIQNLCAHFSPEDLYHLDRNPTLRQLEGWFGRDATLTWMELQLARFNDFCGAAEKMQSLQIEDLACLLFANHPTATIAQLANFFARLKSGCYDRFYKSVDPIKIAASMQMYMEEQKAAFHRLREQEEREAQERREAESRKRCITYEQYLELKRQGKV